MDKIRVACGTVVTLEPILDVSNMYDTTFSELVRLYDHVYSPGALPTSRKKIYCDRKVTLRLALRRVDELGVEHTVDLTGLVPKLRLHQQQSYDQVGDSVDTTDFDLTIESPAVGGMCYVEIGADETPYEGDYTAEVAFYDDPDYATFAFFTLKVEEPEM